jgi:TolB-like protein/DNA-binding winged helix-turn-helix (wHTH) protein/Tfp pilus assembly protein PilF
MRGPRPDHTGNSRVDELGSAEILLFEGFRLDLGVGVLYQLGQKGDVSVPVALGPRTIRLLGLLAARQGEVISKDAIIRTVWPGRVVEEGNLNVQVSKLRQILDQNRGQDSCIQTIPGRGYGFVAPVTRLSAGPQPASPTIADLGAHPSQLRERIGRSRLQTVSGCGYRFTAPVNEPATDRHAVIPEVSRAGDYLQLPATSEPFNGFDDRPAIAVLPFANLRKDPDQQHFADAITDDIITELASWRSFPVIARGSTFSFKGRAVDVQTLSKELRARYLLEGSVATIRQRVRITAQLIDATTGHYLVVERYERNLGELFDIQDEIVETIVGSIAPEVLKVERERVGQHRQLYPTSYNYFIRGLELHYRYSKGDNAEAQRFFRRAIEAEPKNAQAHALLAHAILHSAQQGWHEDSEHNYKTADMFAAHAVALDPRAPFAHFALGSTSMFLGRTEQALAEMQEAVRLNPSHAAAHAIMAHLLCYVGRPPEALESIKRALRLSPHDPRLGLWLPALSQTYYFLEQYEDAIAAARRALSLIPINLIASRFLAASFGQLGMVSDAAPVLPFLRGSNAPTLADVKRSMEAIVRVPKMIEHVLEGLQKAGMT